MQMTMPGTVLGAGDIMMDETQFLHEWNLQFQAQLLENFQVRVQKAEAGRCKHRKDTEMLIVGRPHLVQRSNQN